MLLNILILFNFVILYKLLYICKAISFNSVMWPLPSTPPQHVKQKYF